MVTIGPLADAGGATAVFFSNPASTVARQDITVRRSNDDGASWLAGTWLVQVRSGLRALNVVRVH